MTVARLVALAASLATASALLGAPPAQAGNDRPVRLVVLGLAPTQATSATPNRVLPDGVLPDGARAPVPLPRQARLTVGALARLNAGVVTVPATQAATTAAQLRAAGATVYRAVPRQLQWTPNDPSFATQSWYLSRTGFTNAWNLERGGAATIAVIDSGVDAGHPELASKIVGRYDAVTGTVNGDVRDSVGHGTFVSGVAVAVTNNGVGVAGAAPAARLLAVKVADGNGNVDSAAVANGIVWATDRGAKVINLSLGSDQPDPLESQAVRYALSRNVVVVASAGNDGERGNQVNYPAGYPGVIAVGATSSSGGRAPFSEFGSWLTLAAPGAQLVSTAPRTGSLFFEPSYDQGSGTSFSAPLVSAAVALLRSANPGLSVSQVRSLLVGTATPKPGLGLGAGEVNVAKALLALGPGTVPTLATPTAGESVSGGVALRATSTAPRVRFLIDGAALVTVAPSGGTARATWTTWGWANGRHVVAAQDCTADARCSLPVRASVTLANVAPTLTIPTAGGRLPLLSTATSTAPGGALALLVDGRRVAVDTGAPYAFTLLASTLPDGTRSARVVSCSRDLRRCAGPTSSAVSFAVRSLKLGITSISAQPFSPGSDGRRDTLAVTVTLPDAQYLAWQVRDRNGRVVRGPVGVGTRSGTVRVLWDGRSSTRAFVGDGTFRLELLTRASRAGAMVSGYRYLWAVVDRTPPAFGPVTGGGATISPYVRDGRSDTFLPTTRLSEPAVLTLQVVDRSGRAVVGLTSSRKAGAPVGIVWDGRSASGRLLPPGTYRWRFLAQDVAGNVARTAYATVTVARGA